MKQLRNKCRTCKFLAMSEGIKNMGYCWQCDKPVHLSSYEGELDPECKDVIADGEYSEWRPLRILEMYFWEGDAE